MAERQGEAYYLQCLYCGYLNELEDLNEAGVEECGNCSERIEGAGETDADTE